MDEELDLEAVISEAADLCEVSNEVIEDIYPCTSLQEGIMVLAAKQDGAYVARHILSLPSDVDVAKFCAAWEMVVASTAPLRTRMIQLSGAGIMQVVLKDDLMWRTSSSLSGYLEQDHCVPMSFGTPLTRFALITDPQTEDRHFVLTAHHAIFDGWSLSLVYHRVDQLYKGATVERQPNYSGFIKYLSGVDHNTSAKYVSYFKLP